MRISSQGEDWLFLVPNDQSDRGIDGDSRDENELPPNNLNRSQLVAGATVHLTTSSGNILLGAGDEEEVSGLPVVVPSKRNKGSKVNAFF